MIPWLWIWERHESRDYEYETAMNSMTMNLKRPWIPWLWIWERYESRGYEFESAMNLVIWLGNTHELQEFSPWLHEFHALKNVGLNL